MKTKSDKYINFLLGSVAAIPFGLFVWIGTVDPRHQIQVEAFNQLLGWLYLDPVAFDSWSGAIFVVGGMMLLSGRVMARRGSWLYLLGIAIIACAAGFGWMIGALAGAGGALALSLAMAAGTWFWFRKQGMLNQSSHSG